MEISSLILSLTKQNNKGKQAKVELKEPKSEDLAFIMYTSGTTGIVLLNEQPTDWPINSYVFSFFFLNKYKYNP